MTTTPTTGRPPAPYPDVKGRCPACGGNSLFVAEGGYLTCRRVDCAEPDAAASLLELAAPAPGPHHPDDVLHRHVTLAITTEHYRRARERIEASPEQHSAAMATVALRALVTADVPAADPPTLTRGSLPDQIRTAAQRLKARADAVKHHHDAELWGLALSLDLAADAVEHLATRHPAIQAWGRVYERADAAETALRAASLWPLATGGTVRSRLVVGETGPGGCALPHPDTTGGHADSTCPGTEDTPATRRNSVRHAISRAFDMPAPGNPDTDTSAAVRDLLNRWLAAGPRRSEPASVGGGTSASPNSPPLSTHDRTPRDPDARPP
ncbi:hypothetical protein VSR01_16500 [Actinacidiphila sp. DG2A-62]|uniref:hypothetical protein n=1 Tax=Actinacidiphila sp. DG2A-62 TaxID=3108821 RepID=UPI002DBBEBD6|nr:hypothetical protein [Actinacidiphila sp. DG2A-62]MEC3995047.1 hypothetical protein [Actinacidiphila sp. DG2A-62]